MYKSLLNVDIICRNNKKKTWMYLKGDTVDRQSDSTPPKEVIMKRW